MDFSVPAFLSHYKLWRKNLVSENLRACRQGGTRIPFQHPTATFHISTHEKYAVTNAVHVFCLAKLMAHCTTSMEWVVKVSCE